MLDPMNRIPDPGSRVRPRWSRRASRDALQDSPARALGAGRTGCGATPVVGCHVAMLVLALASAPAGVISPEIWERLLVCAEDELFECCFDIHRCHPVLVPDAKGR